MFHWKAVIRLWQSDRMIYLCTWRFSSWHQRGEDAWCFLSPPRCVLSWEDSRKRCIFREMWKQLQGFQITVTSLQSQLTARSSSFWRFYSVKRSEVVSPSVSSWGVNMYVSQSRSDRLPDMCHSAEVLLGPVLPVYWPPGPVSVCWELVTYRCDSCDSSLAVMWFPLYGSQISDFVFWAAVLYTVAGQQRQYKSFKDAGNKDEHLWTWKLVLIHGHSCLIK